MKKMRKMIALLVAMVMVIGTMSITAFADPVTPTEPFDTPLTITGLDNNDTVNLYKIIEWVGTDTSDPTNTNAVGNVAGWKSFAPYNTVLTEAKLKEVLVGDKTTTPPTAATGITAELAGQLAKLIPSKPDFSMTASGGSNPGSASVTYENVAPGLYMALITPIDVDTVYNPVFLGADFIIPQGQTSDATVGIQKDVATYADKAAAKKSTTSVVKKASTDEDPWDDFEWITNAIGDTVNYDVTFKIPGFGEVYQAPCFIAREVLTGLTLVEDTVTLVAPAGLTDGKEYTLATTAGGFTITFDPDYLRTITTVTDVEVTYDAIVDQNDTLNINRKRNEVSIEYSHDPTDETDHKFKKDTTQHYVFSLDAQGLGDGGKQVEGHTSELVKIARDGAGNPIMDKKEYSYISPKEYWESPLEGAEFAMYTDKNRTPYYPKDKDGNRLTTPLTAKSGADGRFTFAGLDAGTYYFEETAAPAGFIKDNALHEVVIKATYSEKDVTEYTKTGLKDEWLSQEQYDALSADEKAGYKSASFKTETCDGYKVYVDGVETAVYEFYNKGTEIYMSTTTPPVELPYQIINTEGVELPSTGGIGTTLFYVVGSVLVIGAAVLLISKRRMVR